MPSNSVESSRMPDQKPTLNYERLKPRKRGWNLWPGGWSVIALFVLILLILAFFVLIDRIGPLKR